MPDSLSCTLAHGDVAANMTVKGEPAPLAYIFALFALLCAVTHFLGRSL